MAVRCSSAGSFNPFLPLIQAKKGPEGKVEREHVEKRTALLTN